jgi:hypothetical protein
MPACLRDTLPAGSSHAEHFGLRDSGRTRSRGMWPRGSAPGGSDADGGEAVERVQRGAAAEGMSTDYSRTKPKLKTLVI